MRRIIVGLLSLAMAGVTGLLLATSEFSLYNVVEWFGASFENVAVGTKLAAGTGVTTVDGVRSGTWTIPSSASTSAVIEENGVRYLNVYSPVITASGPWLTTTTAAFAGGGDAYRIDCSTKFPITDNLPALPSGVKSAMALSARDGVLSFYGYGAKGWMRLSDSEVEVSTAICYDQRAEFRRINGTLYVTYSIKSGGEYVELKDDDGNILLPAADQGSVRMLEFRGIGNVKSIAGSKLKSSVTAVDVAPEGYPMTLVDWFSVLMAGVDVGTILDADTGVINESGLWDVPYSGFAAEVADDDGEHYLCIEQSSGSITGPNFKATRSSADDRSEIEFSMRFSRSTSVLENSLEDNTKAAMAMAETDGEVDFYGFSKNGWTKLFAPGVEAKFSTWYDLMAAFVNEEGVLYVSYYVKTYFGYVQFVDEKGVGRFVTAGTGKSPVQYANVLGDTDVRFMTGTDMTFDPTISFYWIGGPLGDWANGQNWSHSSGGPAAGDYPKAGDSAIVDTKATIEIHGSDANVSNLVVSAVLTLTGDRDLSTVIWGGTYGSGKIVLASASLRAGAPKEMSFGCNIEIAEGTENRIVNYNDGASAYQLKFTGYLAGKGTVTFTEGRSTNGVDVASGGGVRLLGDTSDFAGTAKFVYENPRAKVAFESAESSDNRESAWSLFEEGTVPSAGTAASDTGLPQFPFKESGRTYRFGSIAGTIPSFKTAEAANLVTNIVLEVGATGQKSSLDGDWMNADAGRTIRWIAPEGSQFEYDVHNTTLIEIVGGGSFKLMSADAIAKRITFSDLGGFLQFASGVDPSAAIHGSSAPIGVDDEGKADGIWRTALDSSNVGGLVKRGEGTLRLTQIPRYSGITRVEAGVLIIPWGTALGQLEIAKDAQVIIDLSGIGADDRLIFAVGSSEGGIKGKFDFRNKPDGYELPDPLWTDDGGVIYSTDTHIFIWTGAADNGGRWSTPENWSVNGLPATKTPGDYDVVKVPVLKNQQCVVVDIPANVWSIQCETGVRPFKFVSPAVTNNYAVDDTSVLTTGSGTLPGMSGVGGFRTSGSIVFDIAADETNRFFGPMSAQALVKRSSGVAVIAGENTFNLISLEGGLLKLGDQRDVEDIRMDCDASVETSFTYSGGKVKAWRSQVGDFYFGLSAGEGAKVTTDYFGGKQSMLLLPDGKEEYSRYRLVTNGIDEVTHTYSLFVLYHAVAVKDDVFLYASVATGGDKLRIWGAGDMHYWFNPKVGTADGIFTGLDYGSKVIADGSDYLTSWFGMRLGNQLDYLGGTQDQDPGVCAAIAEVVGYNRDLTHAERLAIQRSLMTKWGLTIGDYQVLPSCAAVVMKPDAVLDLGGLHQTVDSFIGAGVVSNGVLATENGLVTEDGGALTIPAVSGTTYYLMKRQAELVLTGGKDAAVTVVVPDGCTSGRVFFEGLVDWKVTDPGITIQGPESGWYTIVNTGGGSCIIVR